MVARKRAHGTYDTLYQGQLVLMAARQQAHGTYIHMLDSELYIVARQRADVKGKCTGIAQVSFNASKMCQCAGITTKGHLIHLMRRHSMSDPFSVTMASHKSVALAMSLSSEALHQRRLCRRQSPWQSYAKAVEDSTSHEQLSCFPRVGRF